MNLLFIGGDFRYIKMIKDLREKNDIYVMGYDNINFSDIKKFDYNKDDISKIDIIVLPINGIKKDFTVDSEFSSEPVYIPKDFFNKCKKSVQIFTGMVDDILINMLGNDSNINNLLGDKEIKRGNSLITVEGIIDDLLKKRGTNTIYNSNILVLGYGNIGKPLVEVLNNLGANVSVGVKEKKDLLELCKKKIYSLETYDKPRLDYKLENSDIIINTVPDHVIKKSSIKYIKDGCYILDIASSPYGFDYEDIKDKNYYLYSKIPAKYSPTSSGLLLEKSIKKISEVKK